MPEYNSGENEEIFFAIRRDILANVSTSGHLMVEEET